MLNICQTSYPPSVTGASLGLPLSEPIGLPAASVNGLESFVAEPWFDRNQMATQSLSHIVYYHVQSCIRSGNYKHIKLGVLVYILRMHPSYLKS